MDFVNYLVGYEIYFYGKGGVADGALFFFKYVLHLKNTA